MEHRLPYYAGNVIPNCDYTHGQVPMFPGVRSYQLVRANRTHPELADGTGTTYKHAPDIALWHGKYYVQYLVNERDEHEPGGYSVLAMAERIDGEWTYQVSFPPYRIPACKVTDHKGLTHEFDGGSYAFMHQRMSFYRSSNGRMLLLGFYGWSPERWMTNWDNYGIGRVVRELYPDGALGDIFFIRPNYQAGWSDEQLNYPLYTAAADTEFVHACDELLANRLYTQQWAEENGDQDDIITIKHPTGGTNQAFCWYHIDDDTVIGLWKHSKVARSDDGGKTWGEVTFEPSLIMSGQKIWGQRCSDGSYALLYDPTLESTHRYPLCMVTGDDGIRYDDMRLIHGEVPMRRYKGFWKDFGPQYMRGMTEGIAQCPDDILLVYSVNKEDIWISEIPVTHPKVSEDLKDPTSWCIYRPYFTTCSMTCDDSAPAASLSITIEDRDPVDHIVLTRVLPVSSVCELSFSICPDPIQEKPVYIELLDERNIEAVRITFSADGQVYVRVTDDIAICSYEPGKTIGVRISADCSTCYTQIAVGDTDRRLRFYRAVHNIAALKLSTGSLYRSPGLDTDPDRQCDLPLSTELALGRGTICSIIF